VTVINCWNPYRDNVNLWRGRGPAKIRALSRWHLAFHYLDGKTCLKLLTIKNSFTKVTIFFSSKTLVTLVHNILFNFQGIDKKARSFYKVELQCLLAIKHFHFLITKLRLWFYWCFISTTETSIKFVFFFNSQIHQLFGVQVPPGKYKKHWI
jgi:hypothetical protein